MPPESRSEAAKRPTREFVARPSRNHGRRPGLATVLAFVVLLALAALAGGASAKGSGSSLEIEVCQGTEAEIEECESQQVEQAPSKPKPSGSGSSGSSGESHDFSINKQGEVSRSSSSSSKGQKIEIDLPASEPQAGVESAAEKVANKKPKAEKVAAPDAGGTGLGDVKTTGGAQSFGGSSPFDYVSSDEALSSFAVPPFLIPIYVSAGRAYDIPWNVLASINKIETDFGRLGACAVSYAGARGWMQFMPGTWDAYGVDATGDGIADPCNPVDAIYAAARYLNASGGSGNLRQAIFAYNRADWYVDEVLATASAYGSLPAGLVAETGSLAFGRFPVQGQVRYGDDFREALQSDTSPEGVEIAARGEAYAITTQEVKVRRILLSREAAIALRRDQAFQSEPRPERPSLSLEIARAGASVLAPLVAPFGPRAAEIAGPALASAATAGALAADLPDRARRQASTSGDRRFQAPAASRVSRRTGGREVESRDDEVSAAVAKRADASEGRAGPEQPRWLPSGYEIVRGSGVGVEVSDAAGNRYRYEGLAKLRDKVRPGTKLGGGAKIGPLGGAKHPMSFSTRAAGGALVDPRPLLDGYRLQEVADYYNAVEPLGGNPFLPRDELGAPGAISGTQGELARRVLNDSGISIYPCGRQDIANGIVDRRVLGALLYLRKAGMTMTVTSLRCGHGYYTAGGGVSAHSYGAAVDIAAFNGQSVLGNQGPGSLTAEAVKLLMGLDGEARPAQLISLMDFGGPSFALGDHHDHLHVGYNFDQSLALGRSDKGAPPVVFGSAGGPTGLPADSSKPSKDQERRLSDRLAKVQNPDVRSKVGIGSVQIEGEKRSEKRAAERLAAKEHPLRAVPASAGAELEDVAITEGSGASAYAIGVVDGTTFGWERRQTIILAERDGAWQQLGPPRDPQGRSTDPDLHAIAATADGRGYAVGEKGAVVALRGKRNPLLLEQETKATLADVALPADGKGPAIAVGANGTALAISGQRARSEDVDGKPSLTAVSASGDGFLAVGSQDGGSPALLERDEDGEWSSAGIGFKPAGGTTVDLTTIAVDGAELWVGGSISESSTAETSAELPFAAHGDDGSWSTYCSGTPALANIRELGTPSRPDACDEDFPIEVGEIGPVSAVAITEEGPLFATRSGLRILVDDDFRPVPGAPTRTAGLGVSSEGRGYALAHDGRMTQIEPGRGGSIPLEPTALQLQAGGSPAPVAVSPGGDRALAFSAGKVAQLSGESWRTGPATGLAVRDAGFAGETTWAIDESGTLMSWDGSAAQWDVPGLDAIDAQSRSALADAVGTRPLAPDASGSAEGFQAIAFGSDLEGFAVGGRGMVARFLKDGWELERSNTDVTLRDVAAGTEGVIAVGDEGTLIERGEESWSRSLGAEQLVDGQDFTAAEALGDGTLLAAAGGSLIERQPDSASWRSSELPPLGVPVQQLAGYRGSDGALHVVALAGASQPVLVEGTEEGWRTLPLPADMTATAFAPEPGSERIVVAGLRSARPVATTLDLGAELGGEIESAPSSEPADAKAEKVEKSSRTDDRSTSESSKGRSGSGKQEKRVAKRLGRFDKHGMRGGYRR